MNGRTPTAVEREWLAKVLQVPCVVCSEFHGVLDSPAEIHHTNGQTKPDAHLKTLSLCSNHHRISDTRHPKRWISRHGDGRRIFESRYIPEKALLEIQADKIKKLEENIV